MQCETREACQDTDSTQKFTVNRAIGELYLGFSILLASWEGSHEFPLHNFWCVAVAFPCRWGSASALSCVAVVCNAEGLSSLHVCVHNSKPPSQT